MPEVIDCTPTWEGILPLLLQGAKANPITINTQAQFQAMARNADKLLILAVQANICCQEFDNDVEAAAEFRRLRKILDTITIKSDLLRARITQEIREKYK